MSVASSDKNTDGVRPIDVATTLFADLALPFNLHPNTRDIRPITDLNAIRSAVKNLVLTNFGERPFHPELGTSIYDFLFDPNISDMLVKIEEEIGSAIATWLPYIVVTDLTVRVAETKHGFSDRFNGVQISISFTLAGNRFNEESIVVVIGTGA